MRDLSLSQIKAADQGHIDFLFVELQSGMTFAQLALDANPQKLERNRKNARKAYETLVRFQRVSSMNEADQAKLSAGMNQLKSLLHSLGEAVE